MNIDRRALTAIIEQEVRRRLHELDEKEAADKPRKGKKPSTASADSEPVRKGPPADPVAKNNSGKPQPGDPADSGDDIDGPATDGGQPDPEAAENDPDGETDGVDAEGEAGEEPSGAVNDEVSGKTVQAVTIEPRSQVLPGAKEVVVAFNESTDTLRILITATGQVKFFWRGQLHDIP